MSKPWPPPPDLDSLKELFAAADPEGLIADDCPLDEYDPEAKHFYEITLNWPSSKFTSGHTLAILIRIFADQFNEERVGRLPALTQLAEQIERFFGPAAQPHTRSST